MIVKPIRFLIIIAVTRLEVVHIFTARVPVCGCNRGDVGQGIFHRFVTGIKGYEIVHRGLNGRTVFGSGTPIIDSNVVTELCVCLKPGLARKP